MYLYSLKSDVIDEVSLYQLKDSRFQIVSGSNIGDILIGYEYVLVRDSLAKILKESETKNIEYSPAIILNKKTGEEIDLFQRLSVTYSFDSESIDKIETNGKQVYLMDGRYLFVTQQLKNILAKASLAIKFSEGLSEFG